MGSRWGLALSDYLAVGPRCRLNAQLTMFHGQSTRVLPPTFVEHFVAQMNHPPPMVVLVDILTLAQSPEHMMRLFSDGIIPACIRVIRQYHQDCNKLFDRVYGLMAFDTLSAVLQISILGHYLRLTPFIESLAAQPVSSHNVALAVENETSRAIHDALHAEDFHGELEKILAWSLDKSLPCLIVCGGFTIDDARFILELLWEDRMAFLAIGISHLSPRYGAILFVIWQSMAYTNYTDGLAWRQLHNLVYRYYLFAPPSEAPFLHMMALHTEQLKAHFRTDLPKDTFTPEDSRNFISQSIRLFTLALRRPSLLPVGFASFFYDFAVFHASLSTQDLMPKFIEVLMARLWAEFEDPIPSPVWLFHTAKQTHCVFRRVRALLDEATTDEHRSQVIQTLLEQDFASLAVRALFMTTTHGVGSAYLPSCSVVDKIKPMWNNLIRSVVLLHPEEEEGAWPISDSYSQHILPDLVKALAYQEVTGTLSEDGSPPQTHAVDIMAGLASLYYIVDGPKALPKRRCRSPRCANPTIDRSSLGNTFSA
ncbi:hypothetical protein FRC09_019365 [Ceratobasidium sp. 395]|nr:hypothetical protein FRC09_019365 [Ceratobasidium sp. 395]